MRIFLSFAAALISAGMVLGSGMGPAAAQQQTDEDWSDWQGPYGGGGGGGSSLFSTDAAGIPGFTTGDTSHRSPSVSGNLQAGFNYISGGLLLGLEADISVMNAESEGTLRPLYTARNSVVNTNWIATLRPRIGFTFNQTVLYVTGGLALSHLKLKETRGSAGIAINRTVVSKTKPGWVLGVGVEQIILAGISVRAEYLHTEFGEIRGNVTEPQAGIIGPAVGLPYTHRAKPGFDIGRVGVNFRF